ncbi:hypothetical protein [Nocardioides sp. CFH 31398]|uniref:hypothetical protein n=1 Tax=Nocardioides sp. CFH 31398 TaxID=2919579 RepID=UPI001F0669F0|nr:hypothetical protein [Nocardioides sp. CFH 31398]MCH1865198.1 hypothetical protein [Nocardioides sp. CFH 31398]
MKRLITAIVSVALLGLTPLALTSAASADSIAPAPSAQSSTAGAPEAQAKRARKVTARGKERRNGLFIVGRVTPNYSNSTVIIKRSSRPRGGYTVYNRVKTNGRGYYTSKVVAPRRSGQSFYYFARVAPRGKYSGDNSQVLRASRG